MTPQMKDYLILILLTYLTIETFRHNYIINPTPIPITQFIEYEQESLPTKCTQKIFQIYESQLIQEITTQCKIPFHITICQLWISEDQKLTYIIQTELRDLCTNSSTDEQLCTKYQTYKNQNQIKHDNKTATIVAIIILTFILSIITTGLCLGHNLYKQSKKPTIILDKKEVYGSCSSHDHDHDHK